jgi:hypothetical protein
MSYDHWVADSFATRLILRHVLGRYLRLDLPENDRPLTLYPGTYREMFPQHLGVQALGRGGIAGVETSGGGTVLPPSPPILASPRWR